MKIDMMSMKKMVATFFLMIFVLYFLTVALPSLFSLLLLLVEFLPAGLSGNILFFLYMFLLELAFPMMLGIALAVGAYLYVSQSYLLTSSFIAAVFLLLFAIYAHLVGHVPTSLSDVLSIQGIVGDSVHNIFDALLGFNQQTQVVEGGFRY